MLNVILLVLLALWLLGMVSSYTMGGFIHLLLFLAIAVVLIRVIQGRRPFFDARSGHDSRSAARRAAAGSSANTAGGSGAPGDPARAADRASLPRASGPGPAYRSTAKAHDRVTGVGPDPSEIVIPQRAFRIDVARVPGPWFLVRGPSCSPRSSVHGGPRTADQGRTRH